MKEEIRTEEIVTVKSTKVYISDDGLEFDNSFDCRLHEERMFRKKVEKAYFTLRLVTLTQCDLLEGGCDEIGYDFIHVRNEKDVNTINNMLELNEDDYNNHFRYDCSVIGKNICLSFNYGHKLFHEVDTIKELKTNIINKLNKAEAMVTTYTF